jgi:FMN phosphatase YigB (HAD superfamily)
MEVKEIIFDIGDTIVFTDKIIKVSLEVALNKLVSNGLIKGQAEWTNQYNLASKKLKHLHINHLFSDRKIISSVVNSVTGQDDLVIVGTFLTYFRESVRKQLDNYTIDISIFSYLKSKGFVLNIISDGTTIEALEILTRLKIIQYFSRIIVSEDFGVEKPSAIIFKEFLKNSKTKANSFLMIGDNEIRDIVGAKKIGFKTVLVSPKNIENTEADFVIKNISELHKIL